MQDDDLSNLLADRQEELVREEKKIPGIMFFLDSRMIRNNLILLTLIWMTASFNIMMLIMQVKQLPGNFEANMLAMAASDIPAALCAGFMVRQGFRPKILIASYALFSGLAALSMVLFSDIENSGIEMPILTAFAKMGTIAVYKSLYLTHPDFFPTLFAVTSIGIANLAARGFTIAAPLIAEVDYPMPMILFCTLSVITVISALGINDDTKEMQKVEKRLSKQLARNERSFDVSSRQKTL